MLFFLTNESMFVCSIFLCLKNHAHDFVAILILYKLKITEKSLNTTKVGSPIIAVGC